MHAKDLPCAIRMDSMLQQPPSTVANGMQLSTALQHTHLDLIHEAMPVASAKQSANKGLGIKVLKLVHVLTCSTGSNTNVDDCHMTEQNHAAIFL